MKMMWNIGWGVISDCNMNCEFCYSKTRRKETEDLCYNDWIKFIDENHDCINTINYGTGENTLSDDWFRLIRYIRNNFPDIRQSLTTNGHLSHAVRKKENLEAFIQSIDEVDISLDFADKTKHNTFRGQPKAYDWAVSTLELCSKLKKQATIVFLGSDVTTSYENLDGLFSIAKKYNAILRMNLFRPTDGINPFSQRFIMDRKHFIDVIQYINSKYKILSVGDSYFSPVLTGKASPDPSGENSIRILSDGSITPSTYLIKEGYSVGNIKQKEVLHTLTLENNLKNIISETIPPECKDCVYSTVCRGGVIDRRYLWNGTLEKKDPYCNILYHHVLPPTIKLSNEKFSSVHDGYLPTIFFRP